MTTSLNINLIFVAFIVAFGSSILFGYNLAALNQAKQFIVEFYNATYYERYDDVISEGTMTLLWSLTTAIFIPGGMIGSFLGGWLADKIGRKKTIMFSHIFTIIGAIMSCTCVAARSPELMMLGRFIVGINSGLAMCISPMLLLEITPAAFRGAFGTLHQLSITLGILSASIIGMPQLLGTVSSWPFILLVQLIPAVTSLAAWPFLPDTPKYLLLIKQDRQAAQKSMQFYRRSTDVSADMEEMDSESKASQQALLDPEDKLDETPAAAPSNEFVSYSWSTLLTDADLRKPLMIGCMLVIMQQFSGINAFFFFSQGLFENARIPASVIPFAIVGVNIVNVMCTLIVVPILDRAGRRPLLLIPAIVMVLDLILMTISLVLQNAYTDLNAIGYLSIFCVIVFIICFAFGLGPIPWIMSAELFRQEPRPKAMALINVVMWIASFIIAMTFEPLQAALRHYTFMVFLVLMIGFTLFIYYFIPETKNKTIDEIARELSPSSHARNDTKGQSSKDVEVKC